MDEGMITGLQNFDRVWSRVTGAAEAPTAPPDDDAEVLRGFIAGEAHDAAYYSSLARRTRSASRTLATMAADERGHKRDLQVEYFLLTGDSYTVEPSCPAVSTILNSMRTAYINELEGARGYLAAAEATKSDRLRELYRLNASDEAEHAEALRNMISRAIG
jgi:rubrerythrin